jgi:hypothetical protein
MTQPVETDPFEGAAPPPPREDRPKMRHLNNRLVIVTPAKIERGIPNTLTPGAVQDRITADIEILDGATLMYGDDPDTGKQADKRMEIPGRIEGMYLNGARMVAQLTVREEGGRLRKQVLGRVRAVPNGPGQRPSWILETPTTADYDAARVYRNTVNPFG